MKRFFGAVVVLSLLLVLKTSPVHAVGAKVAPLLYEMNIGANEVKKGHIDISNPNDTTTTFKVELESFKQINDKGELAFEPAPQYSQGIKFDYDKFTLDARESLRLYFIVDANKLPKGGVYATVFFSTIEKSGAVTDLTSIRPSTRVGTLLLIENGGGGERSTEISAVNTPFFHFGNAIKVDATLKNTGGKNGLAFFPKITAKLQPFGAEETKKSKLLFPDIERSTSISLSGSYLGLFRVKVDTGSDAVYTWVFAVTGWGRLLAAVLVAMLGGAVTWSLVVLIKRKKQT